MLYALLLLLVSLCAAISIPLVSLPHRVRLVVSAASPPPILKSSPVPPIGSRCAGARGARCSCQDVGDIIEQLIPVCVVAFSMYRERWKCRSS